MKLPFPRFLAGLVDEALADTPVVFLQGARQVGKSTLAQAVVAARPESRQVTLDDIDVRALADEDPVYFVGQGQDGLLVIDEAQRSPGLILPIKAAVDRGRRPGQFLLTGSADLLKVKGVGDSLAGRAETLELKPLSQGELGRRSHPEDWVRWVLSGARRPPQAALVPDVVLAGGYPEAVSRSPERARRWFDAYIERLAEHDASELHAGGYSDQLSSLLALVASGGQQELVKSKMARSLGIAEGTLDSYLRMAMTMRLIVSYPAWGRSLRGRITRRPKVALNDTGLAAALVGFTAAKADQIGGREFYGSLVEQFVALELDKQRGWSRESFTLSHFRDLDGLEVDLVIELRDGRLIAVEVKSALSVTEQAWRNLTRFRQRYGDREVTGVVLYAGSNAGTIDSWLHVLPITSLWGHPDPG